METMYFGGYAAEFPGGQPVSGYVAMPPMNPQSPSFPTNVSLIINNKNILLEQATLIIYVSMYLGKQHRN